MMRYGRYFLADLLFFQFAEGYAQRILIDGQKILFVGNSKVGSEGGLHHHFRRTLARMDKPLAVDTDWIAMYDKPSLGEMLTDALKKRITEGDDDIVVVQSGAIADLRNFATLIQGSGKKMVVFGTWADNPFLGDNSFEDFVRVMSLQYAELKAFESDSGIPVVPCGLAFQMLLAQKPGPGLRNDFLFTPQSSVQNDLGTLVNVSMLYSVMSGNTPVGLPMWEPFSKSLVEEIQAQVYDVAMKWKEDIVMPGAYKSDPAPLRDYKTGAKTPGNWKPILKAHSKIFYVGNSYIGTEGGLENHFPRLLNEVNSPYKVTSTSRIFWGQGLQRMFTDEVKGNIRAGDEDVVVVTSGPRVYLDSFYREVSAAQKKMVVHMTWGRNPTINEQGIEGYKKSTLEIAEVCKAFERDTGVPVVPCGLIFYDLVVNPPALKDNRLREDWVFMEQNIHQNHIGTMVNAAAHYAVLTGRSPVGLPMWDPYPQELVAAIQQRVWEIVNKWKMGDVIIR